MAAKDSLQRFTDHRTLAWIISIVLHVLIVLFVLLLPGFIRQNPQDGYEGILVSFGLPVESAGDQLATDVPPDAVENEAELEKELQDPDQEVSNDLSAAYTDEDQSPLKLEEKTADRKQAPTKQTQPTTPKEAKVDDLSRARDEFGKLFNAKGDKQNGNRNQGDPLGEPDAAVLEGISKGKGQVGGGLDERGVLFEPEIIEQSQKSGRVVVAICVDKSGKVISANFTQRGSTTTDSELVSVAELSALKYRFMPSEFENQCGTISINFIVR